MVGGFFSLFGCLSCLQLTFDIFLAGSSDTLRRQQMYICKTQGKKLSTLPFADMSPNMAKFRSFLRIFGEKTDNVREKRRRRKMHFGQKVPPVGEKRGRGEKGCRPPLTQSWKKGRQAGDSRGLRIRGREGVEKQKLFFLGASTLLEPSASRFWSAKATVHRQYCCWTASDTHFDFWGHLCWTISKNYKSFQPKKTRKFSENTCALWSKNARFLSTFLQPLLLQMRYSHAQILKSMFRSCSSRGFPWYPVWFFTSSRMVGGGWWVVVGVLSPPPPPLLFFFKMHFSLPYPPLLFLSFFSRQPFLPGDTSRPRKVSRSSRHQKNVDKKIQCTRLSVWNLWFSVETVMNLFSSYRLAFFWFRQGINNSF